MELTERVKGRLLFSGLLNSVLCAKNRLEPLTLPEMCSMVNTFNVFLGVDEKIEESELSGASVDTAYVSYLSALRAKGVIDDKTQNSGNLLLAYIDKLNNALNGIRKKNENALINEMVPSIVSILELFEKDNEIPILDGEKMHEALCYWINTLDVPGYGFIDKLYKGRSNAKKLRKLTEKIQKISKDANVDKSKLEALCSEARSCAAKLRYYHYDTSEKPSEIEWGKIKRIVEKRASLEEKLVEYLLSVALITEGARKTTLYAPLPENRLEYFARNIAAQIAKPAKYKLIPETISRLMELALTESEEEKRQVERFFKFENLIAQKAKKLERGAAEKLIRRYYKQFFKKKGWYAEESDVMRWIKQKTTLPKLRATLLSNKVKNLLEEYDPSLFLDELLRKSKDFNIEIKPEELQKIYLISYYVYITAGTNHDSCSAGFYLSDDDRKRIIWNLHSDILNFREKIYALLKPYENKLDDIRIPPLNTKSGRQLYSMVHSIPDEITLNETTKQLKSELGIDENEEYDLLSDDGRKKMMERDKKMKILEESICKKFLFYEWEKYHRELVKGSVQIPPKEEGIPSVLLGMRKLDKIYLNQTQGGGYIYYRALVPLYTLLAKYGPEF